MKKGEDERRSSAEKGNKSEYFRPLNVRCATGEEASSVYNTGTAKSHLRHGKSSSLTQFYPASFLGPWPGDRNYA